jgi:hypothetical protein
VNKREKAENLRTVMLKEEEKDLRRMKMKPDDLDQKLCSEEDE